MNSQNTTCTETRTVNSIQTKLKHNETMTTTADKSNSIVILPTQQYDTKIQNFLDKNNFQTSTSNPTKTFQNQIRKTVNHSTTLTPQESKWKFIKLHKPHQPIRHIVNWHNAPVYKLSKLSHKKSTNLLHYPTHLI